MASVVTDQDRLDYAQAMRVHCSHGQRPDLYASGDVANLTCPHATSVVYDKAAMVALLYEREVRMPARLEAEFALDDAP
jgi:hypothetical protein